MWFITQVIDQRPLSGSLDNPYMISSLPARVESGQMFASSFDNYDRRGWKEVANIVVCLSFLYPFSLQSIDLLLQL